MAGMYGGGEWRTYGLVWEGGGSIYDWKGWRWVYEGRRRGRTYHMAGMGERRRGHGGEDIYMGEKGRGYI